MHQDGADMPGLPRRAARGRRKNNPDVDRQVSGQKDTCKAKKTPTLVVVVF